MRIPALFIALLGFVLFSVGCSEPSKDVLQNFSDEIEEEARSMMAAYKVSGLSLAVVKGDQVVYAGGLGNQQEEKQPFTAETQGGLFSATKALSSITFIRLHEEGLLDLNAPLESYLDDAPRAWVGIPFWRLLNHTSGIPMIVNKPEFGELDGEPAASEEDIVNIVRQWPLDYEPGEYSRYRQSGYAIATYIAKEETGKEWTDLVAQYITEPAGMQHTLHQVYSGSSDREKPLIPAAGGYLTSAKDMSNFFLALNAGDVITHELLEGTLYDEQYVFGNYSLGSINQEIGDIKTIGHRGGGARANVRYAPAANVGVAVLTDQRDNYDLAEELATKILRRLLLDEAFEPSLRPLFIGFDEIKDQSGEEIVAFYRAAKSKTSPEYNMANAEQDINRMGYTLLREERVADAIAVFELNTREFSNSANTFDSLGEAYLINGDKERALESYRRALTLDPESENAARMIDLILDERNQPS